MKFRLAVFALLLVAGLSGCAGLFNRDAVRVSVAGIQPIEGQGLEMRFAVALRVQNPNESAIDYDGLSLDLEVNGKLFASGVSNQRGSVPRFGEAVVTVPVTVSAFAAARQVLQFSGGVQKTVPYTLHGSLGGGTFGRTRFVDSGTLDIPGMSDFAQ
jgi:LEA14-like dessication related protein